jgi:hypothetical protein
VTDGGTVAGQPVARENTSSKQMIPKNYVFTGYIKNVTIAKGIPRV